VHTTTGNNAAIGRTASGNVYAGADGNAYKHTDSGWSKWNNGGWQPVQPPNNQRTQQNLGGSAGTTRSQTPATRQTLNSSSYQQLEQDRSARFQGGSEGREFSSPEGRSFGGGGGRFRR
jgi:hypothetical protein